MSHQFFEETARPRSRSRRDNADQGLRFGVSIPAPHPEERRLRRVSKDEGPSVASWFETALTRLLTMRVQPQFLVSSTSAPFLIHGIMSRSLAPTSSIGCS